MEPDPNILLNIFISIGSFTGIKILIGFSIIAVLLFLSALVSGSEVAFFSISPKDRNAIKKSNNSNEQRILDLLKQPKRLLATILIANNFINIATVILLTFIVNSVFDLQTNKVIAFFIEVVFATFLIVLFGEIIPKVYATKHGLEMARTMSLPILILKKIFQPLSSVLIKSTAFIDKRITQKYHNVSIDELSHALEITANESDDKEEQKILKGIVAFGNTDAKQIMTPRIDVVAIEYNTNFKEALQKIVESSFSRIPVYKKSIDNIVGTIYIKDLLPHYNKDEHFRWQAVIRSAFIVPESKKIDDLLKEFQEKKIHIAFVVDEYGGISGIISLEDVIEEIVGEINDEFDVENIVYSKLDNQNFVFEGKTSLVDICRILDVDIKQFEEAKGETDTIAGLILELNGELPKKNTLIDFENFTFKVESVDKRRIKRVKITHHEIEQESA